uniref:hypothetical protein n=1 Tax=Nocardioides sp. TaxID=35761 RepID=UPI002B273BCB
MVNGARDTYLEARAVGAAPGQRPMISVSRRTRTSQQVLVPLDSRGRAVLDLAGGSARVRLVVLAYLTRTTALNADPGLHGTDQLRRVLDSRAGGMPPGRETVVRVAGRQGVPAPAASVSATVTLVGARRRGGTVHLGPYSVQHGSSMPRATVGAGEVRSLFVTLPVGAARSWALTRSRGVQVVVDVAGWSLDPVLEVRAPELSRMTSETQSADAVLARQVLVTSSRYAMGTWYDD